MSSQFRPGGPLESTAKHPLHLIPGGIHCWDLIMENGVVDPAVQEIINAETAQIVEWVAEYYTQK